MKYRQTYESIEDKARERQFAAVLSRVWGRKLRPLPKNYVLDYGISRAGRLTAFLEIKVRTFQSTKYASTIVNLDKWIAAREIAQTTGMSCILAVRFTDADFYYTELGTGDGVSFAFGGRHDRGDWQDMGVAVYIPMKFFKRL
ncbi:MAG: hypothetical protein GF418_14600 [Chitinivibrionales bacterium]|nr:hypothetical protein [Chitinivibrionales bacterium]MBD3396850.1 hypothetical protein [Chitinivibrionales bacterium]